MNEFLRRTLDEKSPEGFLKEIHKNSFEENC